MKISSKLSRRELVSELERRGWKLIRNESHSIYSNQNKIVAVPRHNTLSIGVARKVIKAAGLV